MFIRATIKSLVIFFLLNFSLTLIAQQTSDSTRLSLERLYSGEFRQERFGGYNWLGGGDYYTTLERSESLEGGRDIVKNHTKSGKKSILVAAEKLVPEGKKKALRISSYSWSEDQGKLLIFTNTKRVWRAHTKGDYWVYDLKTENLSKLGEGLPTSSLMFAKFTNEAKQIAYVSGHNIYVQSLDNMKITQLTFDGNDDIINGTFDWVYEEEFSCRDGFRWSTDGKYIAFWQLDASEIKDFLMINNTDSIYSYVIPVQYPKAGEDPSSAKLGLIELESKKIVWIDLPGDPRQHYIPRIQWVANTNQLLIRQLNRKQNTQITWLYDVGSAELKKVYTDVDDAWIDIDHPDVAQGHWGMHDLEFLENAKDYIWTSEKGGWRQLYKRSIDGDKEVLLTPGSYDIASYYGLDEKNDIIYFNASPDNATQRYLYQVGIDGSGELKKLTPDTQSGVNTYDFSPNMHYAIHRHSNVTTPPTVELLHFPKNKSIKTLAANEAYKKQMETLNLGAVEFFTVTTEDGIDMDGYMVKPPDFDPSKKYPVLYYLYGEPWGQQATDRWVSLSDHITAQNGYIVILMDNRGTPCLKGSEWRKSIYKKVGQINSRDQAMAAKVINTWDFIDADRIAVWGWSGGGSMTLNLMFRYPEIYKTGMAVASVSNLLYYDNIYQERYMGLPQDNMEDYIAGSPITHAKNLEGNLLIVHGTADDNVHYQCAEALIMELVKHNKKFDVMPYPNCSHGIYEIPGASKHLAYLLQSYLQEHVQSGGK